MNSDESRCISRDLDLVVFVESLGVVVFSALFSGGRLLTFLCLFSSFFPFLVKFAMATVTDDHRFLSGPGNWLEVSYEDFRRITKFPIRFRSMPIQQTGNLLALECFVRESLLVQDEKQRERSSAKAASFSAPGCNFADDIETGKNCEWMECLSELECSWKPERGRDGNRKPEMPQARRT